MTIASVFLISSRTDPNERGTVLAIYTVTLAGLVNMMAAPVSGAIFDAIGARWLYALAVLGYGIGFLSLLFGKPSPQAHVSQGGAQAIATFQARSRDKRGEARDSHF